MQKRFKIGLLVIVLFSIGTLIVLWRGAPSLLDVTPGMNAFGVPSDTEVRLTFSRQLQTQAVQDRLSFDPPVSGKFRWEGNTLVFTPNQPWSEGIIVKARLDPGAPAAGFPPLSLREGLEWTFKVRTLNIAYLFPAHAPSNVYLLFPSTGESVSLTDLPEGVLNFTISLDGKKLFFSARMKNEGSIIYQIDLLSASYPVTDTNNPDEEIWKAPEPVEVLKCLRALCQGLALEPEGRYLAYERSGLPGGETSERTQVWILPLPTDGTDLPFIAGDPTHQTVQPSWSSKNLLAFYDLDEAAYLFIEPKMGKVFDFPNQTGQQGAWHPDGEGFLAPEIFYLDEEIHSTLPALVSFADSRLILYDLISGKTKNLTPGEGVEDAVPVYSPDGSFLAFARKYLDAERWTPGRQLWIARVPGQEARQITNAPLYNHFDFAWSPAGDQIAFVRFNQSVLNEPPEIWVFNLLSGESVQYIKGGYQSQWVP